MYIFSRSRTLLLTAALSCGLISTVQAATTFKIATISPDGTSIMKVMRSGAAEIEKQTEGRVKFKFYPGGVMGNDDAVFRKIRIGQLNGGALTAGALVPVHPDAQLYSIPFIFHSIEEATWVRERMDDRIKGDLRSGGYQVLGMSTGGFARVFSTVPVASIEDLQGQKVWVPSGDILSERALRNANISPVPLPLSDVYTALQTGLLDTVGTSPSAAIALQWHTRVKYMTDVTLGYLMAYLLVEGKDFDKLSAADQKIVLDTYKPLFAGLDVEAIRDNQSALAALQGQGIESVTPDASELKRWHALAQQTIDDVRDSKQYTAEGLAELKRLLAEYRAQ